MRLGRQSNGRGPGSIMLPAEPGREHLTLAHAAALAALKADSRGRAN